MAQTHLSGNTVLHTIFSVLRTPQNFILSLQTVPLGKSGRWVIKIVWVIVLGFGLLKLYKRKAFSILNKDLFNTTLVIISFSLALYLIIIPSLILIYQDKYMIITYSLFILLFLAFFAFPPIKRDLIFSMISVYFISILIFKYKYPAKTYDFKSVASIINKVETKKEPILFFDKSILPPFQFYYEGTNPLLALPPLKYEKDYYEERTKDTSDLKREIQSVGIPSSSYLFITGSIEGFKYDPLMNKENVQEFLKNNYIISLDSSIKSKNSNNTIRIQRLNKR
ncbi:MAG: hypothetical protein ABIR50_03255 [Ginsengibacter sp.]